eukprot:Hpha_TRINITY_DN14740_c0_g1::TRINITY_DN14740_c0_g1_i1::g.103194::m.103194/K20180/VPS16; vacuolar protein sorting-associated protein 16
MDDDEMEQTDMKTQLNYSNRIALSPDARWLAIFNDVGKLFIVSSNLAENAYELETSGGDTPPSELLWGGRDFVVAVWQPAQIETGCSQSLVMVIGRGGGLRRFCFEGPVRLVGECDSLRVISDSACDIILPVPARVHDLGLRLPQDSLEDSNPGRELYDANNDFETEKGTSMKRIRALREKGTLQDAVRTCQAAAAHEFDRVLQEKLLKAAAYGKSFLYEPTEPDFTECCKRLRILNAVRSPEVGIPLTAEQYRVLSPETLVERLAARRLYLLSFRISGYLKSSTAKVLVAWACAQVRSHTAVPERLVQRIEDRFRECPGVPYHQVAEVAWAEKKEELAIQLLEKEPKVAEQVARLLRFKEPDRALQKALDACNTDLVTLVLADIKKRTADEERPTRDLNDILSGNAAARDIYLAQCQDRGFAQKFFRQTGQHAELASLALQTAAEDGTSGATRKKCLEEALKSLRDSGSKPLEAEAKIVEDGLRLWERQSSLGAKPGESLAETLATLFAAQKVSDAEKLKKDFSVSDRMFTWIRLRTLCRKAMWDALFQWLNKSKPVIGFKAVVKECLRYNKDEAAKYVHKIPDPAERCEMFCNLGKFKEAIDLAIKEQEEGFLSVIYSRTDPERDKVHRDRIRKELGQ